MRLGRLSTACILGVMLAGCDETGIGTSISGPGGGEGQTVSLQGTFTSIRLTDSAGLTLMRWEDVTSTATGITGTAFLDGGGQTATGTLTGTLEGRTLTFTITVPRGGFAAAALADCTVTLSGRASNVTAEFITGTYTGTNSCTPDVPISGSMTLRRRQ